MTAWVQPLGDPDRRIDIPHATTAQQSWVLDGGYAYFAGRNYPAGLRGEAITSAWSVAAVWASGERGQAEAFINLLRDVSMDADSRLDVHVGDPVNGTAVEFVGECHEVPQSIAPGSTTVDVTFIQVDS